MDEGFFPGATDASSPFLQFRQGYSRLGRCTRGVVAALVLVYEDEQQASDAVHALVQDIPASAVAVSLTGTNDADNQKKVWKVQGTEGTQLYVALWQEGSIVKSITVETPANMPEKEPLQMLKQMLDAWQ